MGKNPVWQELGKEAKDRPAEGMGRRSKLCVES